MAIMSQALTAVKEGAETSWCNTILLRNTTLTPHTLTSDVEGGDIVLALVKTRGFTRTLRSRVQLSLSLQGLQEIEALFLCPKITNYY